MNVAAVASQVRTSADGICPSDRRFGRKPKRMTHAFQRMAVSLLGPFTIFSPAGLFFTSRKIQWRMLILLILRKISSLYFSWNKVYLNSIWKIPSRNQIYFRRKITQMWFYKDIKKAQDELENENRKARQEMTTEERYQSLTIYKFFSIYFLLIFFTILVLTHIFSISFLHENDLVSSFVTFMQGIIPTLNILEIKSTFPKTAQFIYSAALLSIPLVSIPIRNVLISNSSLLQRKRSREMTIVNIILLFFVLIPLLLVAFSIFNFYHPSSRRFRRLDIIIPLIIHTSFHSKIVFSSVSATVLLGISALIGKIFSMANLLPRLKRE